MNKYTGKVIRGDTTNLLEVLLLNLSRIFCNFYTFCVCFVLFP